MEFTRNATSDTKSQIALVGVRKYAGPNRTTLGEYFNGLMDDARIYGRALTGGEVKRLAAVESSGAATAGGAIGGGKKPHAALRGNRPREKADPPDDRPREHVETVGKSPHAHQIDFRGTVDGVMTRSPIGISAYTQGWQPNLSVLIENVGQTDVRSPRIVVNGRRNWHTLEDVVAEASRGYTPPPTRPGTPWISSCGRANRLSSAGTRKANTTAARGA